MLAPLLLLASSLSQGVGGEWSALRAVGVQEDEEFGFSVAILSDLDDDGFRDVLVGSPGHDGGVRGSGRMSVISGRDLRTPIHVVRGGHQLAGMGRAVSGAGDMDGDGLEDFAGSFLGGPAFSGPGSVAVHSGATGARIHEIVSPDYHNYEFGRVLAGAGDLDLDGYDDLLVSTLMPPYEVLAISGASGGILYRTQGTGLDGFGVRIAVLGQLDADQAPDFAVSAISGRDAGGLLTGAVHVCSGATGTLLYRLTGVQENGGFGSGLAAVADVDGDGAMELLVGSGNFDVGGTDGAGAVYLYSGRAGLLLHALYGVNRHGWLGSEVVGIGDVTGDGAGDYAAGESGYPSSSRLGGRVLVFDGARGLPLGALSNSERRDRSGQVLAGANGNGEGPVLLDSAHGTDTAFGEDSGAVLAYSFSPRLAIFPNRLSAAAGALVRCNLDFGADSAGEPYLLLPSLTGTGPEPLGRILVPLSVDRATLRWLRAPPPFAFGCSGRLDVHGLATAELRLAAGTAGGLAGSSAWFAALALDADEGLKTSIAVTLWIDP